MRAFIAHLNGYRLVYLPEHHKALSGTGYGGYVYEHVLIAERMLGRCLLDGEVVHHLDFCRSNNNFNNLLVLSNSQHTKLHMWLRRGAPGLVEDVVEPGHCAVCGICLSSGQDKYCSNECWCLNRRKVQDRPSAVELATLIANESWVAIGRMYGVSDNAIRKWARSYGLL